MKTGESAGGGVGGKRDAVERARRMLAQSPEHELALFSMGKALLDEGQWGEAQGYLERALKKKPDWMAVQIWVGRCLLNQGKKAEAREAFERARELAIAQNHEGPLAELDHTLSELN